MPIISTYRLAHFLRAHLTAQWSTRTRGKKVSSEREEVVHQAGIKVTYPIVCIGREAARPIGRASNGVAPVSCC